MSPNLSFHPCHPHSYLTHATHASTNSTPFLKFKKATHTWRYRFGGSPLSLFLLAITMLHITFVDFIFCRVSVFCTTSHQHKWNGTTIIFIIFWDFWCFTKCSFHHKWNEGWLLLINVVYTNCRTSSRTT